MMGTLATVLAKKKIRTFQDRYQATVTGDIESVDGVLKITRIHVHYDLKAPADKHADAREALDNYIKLRKREIDLFYSNTGGWNPDRIEMYEFERYLNYM